MGARRATKCLARAAGAIAHASKLGLGWEPEGRPSAAFFISLPYFKKEVEIEIVSSLNNSTVVTFKIHIVYAKHINLLVVGIFPQWSHLKPIRLSKLLSVEKFPQWSQLKPIISVYSTN